MEVVTVCLSYLVKEPNKLFDAKTASYADTANTSVESRLSCGSAANSSSETSKYQQQYEQHRQHCKVEAEKPGEDEDKDQADTSSVVSATETYDL